MRQGVGADHPQSKSRVSGQPAQRPSAQRAPSQMTAQAGQSHQARADISQFFFDLRNALRLTPHHVAVQIMTRPETISALETGQFEILPPWPETCRIVMAFTAMAGIDGRPVLAVIGDVLAQTARDQQNTTASAIASQQQRFPVARLRQAGSALANGAKRIPVGAINQVRQRPERAFYAVSLPLGIVLLLLNTSTLQAAFSNVPRPVARMAQDVRQFFQVRFAPVREGLRWIEVDDPRRRRGDKLR